MRRRFPSSTALAIILTLPSTSAAAEPAKERIWYSAAESAAITSCTTGNRAEFIDAYPLTGGFVEFAGRVDFCGYDGSPRWFGLEIFTNDSKTGASGVFIGFDAAATEFRYVAARNWPTVTAVCISAAPNDRLSCRSLRCEDGILTLVPVPTDDPRIQPAGDMYKRRRDPPPDPSCATCI